MNLCRLRETRPHGSLIDEPDDQYAHDPHDDLPADLRARLPVHVNEVKALGHGRAAKAVLVDAVMQNGQTIRCVEKIFAPGRLTRTIYRLGFQAPFAYQKNIHAALTSFYRRRVASAAIRASDMDAKVAAPLYVRFDSTHQAWVLAAQWVDGRGIRPAEPHGGAGVNENSTRAKGETEIQQILRTMRSLESVLADCGLVGSGWQVAPSAMVSTANLLRTDDHYTVIDLESGIPAVLVPRYLFAGLRRGCIPPFDDLDANTVATWFRRNERLLTFRLGVEETEQLAADVRDLIHHDQSWKRSEIAIARRPIKWFKPASMKPYQSEYVRQLVQDQKLTLQDPSSARLRWMWWAGCIPTRVGDFLQKLIGNSKVQNQAIQWLHDSSLRLTTLQKWANSKHDRMIASERLSPKFRGVRRIVVHAVFGKLTPKSLHRYLSDPDLRKQRRRQAFLLAVSPTYQAWFGEERITRSINKWVEEQRLDAERANELQAELSGDVVRAYVRGFGLHFALKGLTPVWVPIKLAGTAAFIASGNFAYLTPFLITPALRLAVTVQSWWKQPDTPHREAMWLGCLPVIGLVAFPMQMFTARPGLSAFMIRDVAAKLGRRLPIYGGKDSRTEIACIGAADCLVTVLSRFDHTIKRWLSSDESLDQAPPRPVKFKIPSRWGRWLHTLAEREIQRQITSADSTTNPDQREAA